MPERARLPLAKVWLSEGEEGSAMAWRRELRVVVFALAAAGSLVAAPGSAQRLAGCAVFPADNIWNARVDELPRHPRSDAYVAAIGFADELRADFGSGDWPPGSGSPIGIPFVVVPRGQERVPVRFTWPDESDAGPYPVPADAPIEGGPGGTGDRHVLILEQDSCELYELYNAFSEGSGASWRADSGALFRLGSHRLRPAGWTSADAAGLPILPGLVRYEEVAAGAIRHALRFTAPRTRRDWVWPARHFASSRTDPDLPPMGQRFRLRAGFDITGFSPRVRVILTALKRYGMMLADNGSAWFLSGAPDQRWDNDELRELRQVTGSDFEAIDVSSRMVDPGSGRVASGGGAGPPAGQSFFTVFLGPDRYEPVADCLRFTTGQLCAGQVCGSWQRAAAGGQRSGFGFAFDLLDEGKRVRVEGDGRYDRRGEGDSIAGTGRSSVNGRNLSFSFAGRAVGQQRCRALRQSFNGDVGAWWRHRR
jgi:hypothetical protein